MKSYFGNSDKMTDNSNSSEPNPNHLRLATKSKHMEYQGQFILRYIGISLSLRQIHSTGLGSEELELSVILSEFPK